MQDTQPSQFYIRIHQVQAFEQTRAEYLASQGIPTSETTDSAPGYTITYPDGYVSWCPKKQFERNALPMGPDSDGTSITDFMVEDFIDNFTLSRMGNHTVCCAKFRNGFTVIEESACVDERNYDVAKGTDYALQKVRRRVWHLLGFLLATARNGISPKGE